MRLFMSRTTHSACMQIAYSNVQIDVKMESDDDDDGNNETKKVKFFVMLFCVDVSMCLVLHSNCVE